MRKMNLKKIQSIFLLFPLLFFSRSVPAQDFTFPPGIVLNLNFQHIKNGLIPNKARYPLYVPIGTLSTATTAQNKTVLQIKPHEGLSIPHSFLLDPHSNEWVITLRVFIQSEGLILSQENQESGYAIYVKDGAIRAAVRTKAETYYLQENREYSVTNYKNRWVTIDLQLLEKYAILSLSRNRAAKLPLKVPMFGKNFKIQIGQHTKLPLALKDYPNASTNGFSGAIRSLKILRQSIPQTDTE
jgi:hypothetical protein